MEGVIVVTGGTNSGLFIVQGVKSTIEYGLCDTLDEATKFAAELVKEGQAEYWSVDE